MPELHKNQIQWEAPAPKYVSLDKPSDVLGRALTSLGEVSDEISRRFQKVADDKLKADIERIEMEMNDEIDNAQSATADYDYLSEKVLSGVQSAFNNYDEATRTRFMRANPNYFQSLQVATEDKIQQKRTAQLEETVDTEIPRWTVEAYNMGYGQGKVFLKNQIEERLGGLSKPEVIAKKVFAAYHDFDMASATNGLNGDEKTIRSTLSDLKSNTKKYDTLDIYERAALVARGNAELQSLANARAAGTSPEFRLISEMYARYAQQQDSAGMQDLYANITGVGGNGIILIGAEQDKDGNIVPQYFDMNTVPTSQRLALATKLSNDYDKFNVSFKNDVDQFKNDVMHMQSEYLRVEKSAGGPKALVISEMIKARNKSFMWSKLDDETRKQVNDLIEQYNKAQAEAIEGSPAFKHVLFRTAGKKVQNPVDLLVSRIQNGEALQGVSLPQVLTGDMYDAGSPVSAAMNRVPAFSGSTMVAGVSNIGGDSVPRSAGQLLQDSIDARRKKFYPDLGRGTVGEYVLLNTQVLSAMRDAGKLDETPRLAQTSNNYARVENDMMSSLVMNGLYNKTMTDDDKSIIDKYYSDIVGGKLTTEEYEIAKKAQEIASSGQANRDSNALVRYLTRPEPASSVENMGGSRMNPQYEQLQEVTKLGSKFKTITESKKKK